MMNNCKYFEYSHSELIKLKRFKAKRLSRIYFIGKAMFLPNKENYKPKMDTTVKYIETSNEIRLIESVITMKKQKTNNKYFQYEDDTLNKFITKHTNRLTRINLLEHSVRIPVKRNYKIKRNLSLEFYEIQSEMRLIEAVLLKRRLADFLEEEFNVDGIDLDF